MWVLASSSRSLKVQVVEPNVSMTAVLYCSVGLAVREAAG